MWQIRMNKEEFKDMNEKNVVIREDEKNVVWCPTCGAAFYKDSPNWGRETCGHCGTVLNWENVEKED